MDSSRDKKLYPVQDNTEDPLASYKRRLKSFSKCTNKYVSAHELATAGFEYDNGMVLCGWCGLQFASDYAEHFDPLAFHRAESKRACFYLKNNLGPAKELLERFNLGPPLPFATEALPQVVVDPKAPIEGVQNRPEKEKIRQANYCAELEFRTQKMKNLLTQVREQGPLNFDLRRERSRLETFRLWLEDPTLIYTRLARDGMYLWVEQGNIKRLRCAFCDLSMDIPATSVEAMDSHMVRSPDCIMNNPRTQPEPYAANIPDLFSSRWWKDTAECQRSNITMIEPEHEAFISPDTRLDTISKTFPYPANTYIDLAQASAAGYFYGGNEDTLTCFYCGCESANWNMSEDPWTRHARTSPDCAYLLIKKRPEFVRNALEQHGSYVKPVAGLSDEVVDIEFELLFSADFYQKAIDQGIPRDWLENEVKRRIRAGEESFSRLSDIVKEFNKDALKQPKPRPINITKPLPNVVQTSIRTESNEEQPSAPSEVAGTSGLQGAAQSRAADGQQLKELLNCKVCLNQAIEVCSIPCFHQAMCLDCVLQVDACPICREEIDGVIPCYLPSS